MQVHEDVKNGLAAIGAGNLLRIIQTFEAEIARITKESKDTIDHRDGRIAALEKRLSAAMERENNRKEEVEAQAKESVAAFQKLKAEADELRRENHKLKADAERFANHPEVKRAAAELLKRQRAELDSQIAALEGKKEDEKKAAPETGIPENVQVEQKSEAASAPKKSAAKKAAKKPAK